MSFLPNPPGATEAIRQYFYLIDQVQATLVTSYHKSHPHTPFYWPRSISHPAREKLGRQKSSQDYYSVCCPTPTPWRATVAAIWKYSRKASLKHSSQKAFQPTVNRDRIMSLLSTPMDKPTVGLSKHPGADQMNKVITMGYTTSQLPKRQNQAPPTESILKVPNCHPSTSHSSWQ